MIIEATCSICGKTEIYKLNKKEEDTLILYRILGRDMGFIQNLFPNVPAWIRSGAIDESSNCFCICPDCCG